MVRVNICCVIFQLRMSTPWLSVTEKPSEMEEKLRLAKRYISHFSLPVNPFQPMEFTINFPTIEFDLSLYMEGHRI